MSLDGRFVVAGGEGPKSGLVWPTLEAAKKYRALLRELYPSAGQEIYLLVHVPTGGRE